MREISHTRNILGIEDVGVLWCFFVSSALTCQVSRKIMFQGLLDKTMSEMAVGCIYLEGVGRLEGDLFLGRAM